MIRKFTELDSWRTSYNLALKIYSLTNSMPRHELFGLSSQLRRAAVSISSNIAEAFKRKTEKDKIHFYTISLGSLNEVESQLLISKGLHYINDQQYGEIEPQIRRCEALIYGMIRRLSRPRNT